MNEKEYFEFLVSLEMDEPLSKSQQMELETYLQDHPELREFRDEVRSQAKKVKELPIIKAEGSLPVKSLSQASPNWLTNLLRYRVNIPLPAAAAILLLLIGSLALNFRNEETRPPASTYNLAETSTIPTKYVREIKLKPVQAEIIPSREVKDKKESST